MKHATEIKKNKCYMIKEVKPPPGYGPSHGVPHKSPYFTTYTSGAFRALEDLDPATVYEDTNTVGTDVEIPTGGIISTNRRLLINAISDGRVSEISEDEFLILTIK